MTDLARKLQILRWMLADTYETWRSEVLAKDLDSRHCCDGRECACGGMTIDEAWSIGHE